MPLSFISQLPVHVVSMKDNFYVLKNWSHCIEAIIKRA